MSQTSRLAFAGALQAAVEDVFSYDANDNLTGISNPKTGDTLDLMASSEIIKHLTKPSVKRGKRGLSALFHEITALARMGVATIPILTARLGIVAN